MQPIQGELQSDWIISAYRAGKPLEGNDTVLGSSCSFPHSEPALAPLETSHLLGWQPGVQNGGSYSNRVLLKAFICLRIGHEAGGGHEKYFC